MFVWLVASPSPLLRWLSLLLQVDSVSLKWQDLLPYDGTLTPPSISINRSKVLRPWVFGLYQGSNFDHRTRVNCPNLNSCQLHLHVTRTPFRLCPVSKSLRHSSYIKSRKRSRPDSSHRSWPVTDTNFGAEVSVCLDLNLGSDLCFILKPVQ